MDAKKNEERTPQGAGDSVEANKPKKARPAGVYVVKARLREEKSSKQPKESDDKKERKTTKRSTKKTQTSEDTPLGQKVKKKPKRQGKSKNAGETAPTKKPDSKSKKKKKKAPVAKEKADQGKAAKAEKPKRKAKKARVPAPALTKLVVRALPSQMREDDFIGVLQKIGFAQSNILYFVPGKVGKRRTLLSRAYLTAGKKDVEGVSRIISLLPESLRGHQAERVLEAESTVQEHNVSMGPQSSEAHAGLGAAVAETSAVAATDDTNKENNAKVSNTKTESEGDELDQELARRRKVAEELCKLPVVVEIAPQQKVPRKAATSDKQVGTIEQDPTYLQFLEELKKEKESKEVDGAEKIHPEREASTLKTEEQNEEKVRIAPLVAYLQRKAAEKQAARVVAKQRQKSHTTGRKLQSEKGKTKGASKTKKELTKPERKTSVDGQSKDAKGVPKTENKKDKAKARSGSRADKRGKQDEVKQKSRQPVKASTAGATTTNKTSTQSFRILTKEQSDGAQGPDRAKAKQQAQQQQHQAAGSRQTSARPNKQSSSSSKAQDRRTGGKKGHSSGSRANGSDGGSSSGKGISSSSGGGGGGVSVGPSSGGARDSSSGSALRQEKAPVQVVIAKRPQAAQSEGSLHSARGGSRPPKSSEPAHEQGRRTADQRRRGGKAKSKGAVETAGAHQGRGQAEKAKSKEKPKSGPPQGSQAARAVEAGAAQKTVYKRKPS